jgi:nitronate monooxygenase
MAGAMDWELAAAAAQAGALGSLPCAMLDADQIREQLGEIRAHTTKPINLGFFCHAQPVVNNQREARWRERLAPYYRELEIDPAAPVPSSNRSAFDGTFCEVVEELKPEVVSFHFGLPEPALLRRVKAAGCVITVPPRPLPKRAGSKGAAWMRSLPRVTRPAVIGAYSWATTWQRRRAPSR